MTSSLTNIRVNNIPASSVVRILDGSPTVSWTFLGTPIVYPTVPPQAIASTVPAIQSTYEVRVSTSTVNWGSSSFTGTVVATGQIPSDNQFYQYNGFNLNRGTTYYGQVQTQDQFGVLSSWCKFSMHRNAFPSVSDVSISPTSPTTSDSLSVSYLFTDPDGDSEGSTGIHWFHNGVHERWLDGRTTVISGYLAANDQWIVQIQPNDGYESGETVTSSAITVSGSFSSTSLSHAMILPEAPTTADPLYAYFDSAGDATVSVEWFLNEALVTAATGQAFFRFDFNVGDSIYFVASCVSDDSPITLQSPTVTIGPIVPYVFNLRINGEQEPLNVANQTPVVEWDVFGNDSLGIPTIAQLQIGHGPELGDIFQQTISLPSNQFLIPRNLLDFGSDYWVSVAVGYTSETLGPATSAHFRLSGSLWENAVNNSTGWTVEGHVKATVAGQGIRLADGAYAATVSLLPNLIQITSQTNVSAAITLSDRLHTVTLVGQDSSLTVYVDQLFLVEVTMSEVTNDTYVEFGLLQTGGIAEWAGFAYSVDGPLIPGTAAYEKIAYATAVAFPQQQITDVNTWGDDVLVSTQTLDSTAAFYVYRPFEMSLLVPTVCRTYTPINRITNSPNGQFTYFAHANGAMCLKNHPIVCYDQSLNLIEHQPETSGWTLFSNNSQSSVLTPSGLCINTLAGGKRYYSQDRHGSPWFDGVDNSTGWIFDFNLAVLGVENQNIPVAYDSPQGAGVFISDGLYNEIVNFFQDSIVLASSGLSVSIDTSIASDYRLVGDGTQVELWSKRDGASAYSLILQGQMSLPSTSEGNAASPSSVMDVNGVVHAVWRDDGVSEGRQILYSYYASGVWSTPEIIVPPSFDANDPVITAARDSLYVVFEQNNNEYTNVGYVVRNSFGWGQPSAILNGGHVCTNPQIAANTKGTLYVVWEDYRYMTPCVWSMSRDPVTGQWTDLGQINISSVASYRPSIDVNGNLLAVSWTQWLSNTSTGIFGRNFDILLDAWQAESQLSGIEAGNADFSDILVIGTTIQVVWQDDVSGAYQIYAHFAQYVAAPNDFSALTVAAFNVLTIPEFLDLAVTSAIHQMTNNSNGSEISARFPKIAFNSSLNNTIVAFQQSNDIDDQNGLMAIPTLFATVLSQVYNNSTNTWYASSILMNFANRYCWHPSLAKHVQGPSHILYEAQVTTTLPNLIVPATFTSIRDIVYNSELIPVYNVPSTSDLRVSGILPRKEIRFGDFSDSYKVNYRFSRVSMYLSEAVRPFEIGSVSSSNAPIADDRSYDAIVNNNGDAWLATQSGLSFYMRSLNTLMTVNSTVLGSAAIVATAIDHNGFLFVATSTGIYGGNDHFTFVLAAAISGAVTQMLFDQDNTLWVSTNVGVFGFILEESFLSTSESSHDIVTAGLSSTALTQKYLLSSGGTPSLPSNNCQCLALDPANALWVGTDNGLAVFVSGSCMGAYTTANSGLLGNSVTGIAIRSENVRYVATTAGVSIMTGDNFARFVADNTDWNNNARAILFQAPNTLWITSLSDICQVQLDDETGQNHALIYNISNYAPNAVAYNNLRTYYVSETIASDVISSSDSVSPTAEVFVNGRRVDYGFVISSDNSCVQFSSPLKASDVVQINYRYDLGLHTSLAQNHAELAVIGKQPSCVQRFAVVPYLAANGTTQETVVFSQVETNDIVSLMEHDAVNLPALPFDEIVFDTTPPTGELRVLAQLSRDTLEMSIEYAEDNLSGVAQMALSSFPNMTTDGVTPVIPVDFATEVIYSLAGNLSNVATLYSFPDGGPKGNKVVLFTISANNSTFYVGTKYGAQILTWNAVQSQFIVTSVLDPSPAASVDFMLVYKTYLVVGVGTESGTSKILYSSDGVSFQSLGTIAAPHVYAACSAFNSLWIGDSYGNLYSYAGGDPTTNPVTFVVSSGQDCIWAIQSASGQIYMATGGQGNLVAYNPSTDSQMIIYTDADPNLTSIDVLLASGVYTLYVGTSSSGRVLSGIVGGKQFDISYQYLPSQVSKIEIDDAAMRFSIGNGVWMGTAAPTFSGWTPFATFNETVADFAPAATTGTASQIDLWVVTQDAIYNVQPPNIEKKIFLQLIDNAGNKSIPGNIFDGISLAALLGYVNENRIIKIDRTGNLLDYIDGTAPYYSATQVQQESADYYSEIFFGTNSLLSWDLLTFACEVPTGTQVTISLRSANSRDAILTTDWQASYTSNFSSGVDISFLQGSYIQFRAVLSTTTVNATPLLQNVIIRSKTSASTHFYTTNFILGSQIAAGLLTAQTVVPVAAEVIFGLDTLNSTDISTYQVVPLNQIFTMNPDQIGTNLRVGIKFITPTPSTFVTNNFEDYGPYDTPLFVNVVDFSHSEVGSFNYEVSFYSDPAMTQLVYTSFTQDDATGWTINGTTMTTGGVQMTEDQTSMLSYGITGATPLVCNVYYFVKVQAYNLVSEIYETLVSGDSFISACNTNFVDNITFEYVATETATFQFRVRLYNDIERTDLYKVYYTGTNALLWTQGGLPFPSMGLALLSGDKVTIEVTPPSSDLALDTIYYLIIDAFNGTTFGLASNSLTFRVSDPTADVYCGEYHNVPIVQNFALQLTLVDGTTVTLNAPVNS